MLLIESDSLDAFAFCAELEANHPGEFAPTVASDLPTACSLLERQSFDVIAFDLDEPGGAGLNAIAQLQSAAPQVGVVVFTDVDDPKFAVQALQAGAQDCLVKHQLQFDTISRALRHAEERKRAERRLANIAFHDPLTGLANRSLFRQHLARATAFAKRSRGQFAVLILDLDRFKEINDSLGHDAGDIFLQEVAHRLQLAVRETDTVARLGGDEFAVLATPLTDREDIEALAQRILGELRRPLEMGGSRIQPTASIGAALFPDSGPDGDSLLSAADAALYVVKENGRDGLHVHGVELKRRVAHRAKLEQQVREAVEQKQFQLHYQPQLSFRSAFLAAEGLLRWTRPGQVPMEACDFFRILEDTGLLVELGPWLIESACQQLRDWRKAGLWVDRMGINVSFGQLTSRDFVSRLRKATRDAELQCCDIELELTESTIVRESDQIHSVLHQLSLCGYRLALDNFGTGYSSLGYLKNYPISTLKLDRSFVQALGAEQHHRALVGGIIQLASRLGLDIVAEGVETDQQLEVLHAEGCTLLQGYLIGSVMTPEQFSSRCRRAALDAPEPGRNTQLVSTRVCRARATDAPKRRTRES